MRVRSSARSHSSKVHNEEGFSRSRYTIAIARLADPACPCLVLVSLLAATDVNPFARLRRSARELEDLGGKELVVIERAGDDLNARIIWGG